MGIATVAGCLDGTNPDDDAGTDDGAATSDSDDSIPAVDESPADVGNGGSDTGTVPSDDGDPAAEGTDDGKPDGQDDAEGEADDGSAGEDEGEIATYDVSDAVSMTVELEGEEKRAVAPGDVETVSDVQYFGLFNVPYVSVTISDDGTESFVEAVKSVDAFDDPSSTELHTDRSDERLHTSTLGADLAEQVRRGEFEGTFNTSFGSEEQAEQHIEELTAE